jgi:hypothetical protein
MHPLQHGQRRHGGVAGDGELWLALQHHVEAGERRHVEQPTNHLWVQCPVIRDNTQYEDEMDMRIFFDVEKEESSVECWFSSRDFHGGQIDQDHDEDWDLEEGPYEILLTTLEQVQDGFSTLTCRLPPNEAVRLTMYRTTEHYDGEGATDSKTYGGAFSEPLMNSVPLVYDVFEGSAFREWGSGGGRAVVVPLVRDVVASTWNRARLRIFDANTAGFFNCRLQAYNENGFINSDASSEWTSGSGQDNPAGEATMELQPKDGNEVAEATYIIVCDVTGGELSGQTSGIFMYDLREHN